MKVVLVSDTHLTERAPAFRDNWSAVRAWLEATGPDLVVHLGDVTAHGADDSDELEDARSVFDELHCDVRFLPGNHDIGDNPIAPGRPSDHPLDLGRLVHFRRLFGPDRWVVRVGAWQLVGLDAQLFGTDTVEEDEQFFWLEGQLREGSGPLGLLLHKPLFRDGPGDTEAHVRYVPVAARRRLLHALSARDLRFVASGHAHQARRLSVGAVEHLWAPSTAYRIPDALQERIGQKLVGVLALDLHGSEHRVDVIIPEGVVQHDLADHPHVYPSLAAGRVTAGESGALRPQIKATAPTGSRRLGSTPYANGGILRR
jgi:3',5'-cyclic AMP phosphodiesterase CpdA